MRTLMLMRGGGRSILVCAAVLALLNALAQPASAQTVTVSASPSSAAAGLNAEIEVTALVKDQYGNPVSNEYVVWSGASSGSRYYSWFDSTTDANGIAVASIINDTAENVLITAEALGVSDNITITFTGADDDYVAITNPLSGSTWSTGTNVSISGEFTPGTGHSGPYAIHLEMIIPHSGGITRVVIDGNFAATFGATPSAWGPKVWNVPSMTVGTWDVWAHLKTDGGVKRKPGHRITAAVN